MLRHLGYEIRRLPEGPIRSGRYDGAGVKGRVRAMLRRLGYEVRHLPSDPGGLGRDEFWDMRTLAASPHRPVIFDVGANLGQSIGTFRKYFDRPIIHSFEPSPETFGELQRQVAGLPDLYLNDFALGSRSETKVFIENTYSNMSSFLEPGSDCWGEVKGRRELAIRTLDDYCAANNVRSIDILKLDTQGFDLEVIRGGAGMIGDRAIQMIYMEINFARLYEGLPALDEIFRHLTDLGFALVSFYEFHYQHDRAAWTDALFLHPGHAAGGRLSRAQGEPDASTLTAGCSNEPG